MVRKILISLLFVCGMVMVSCKHKETREECTVRFMKEAGGNPQSDEDKKICNKMCILFHNNSYDALEYIKP